MEIKVRCVCGSEYSFEDTPVDGRLQSPVSCTNCGADGTNQANAYIAAKLSGRPDPLEQSASGKGFSGFLRRKSRKAGGRIVLSAPKISLPHISLPDNSLPDPDEGTSAIRLAAGIAGALAVGVAGAFGWLYLAKETGYEFGIAAWILGGVVGLTARLLVPRGHHWLGRIAAVAALVAIGGGELLTAKWALDQVTTVFVSAASQSADNYAAQAIAAKSDADLRPVVARFKVAKIVGGEDPKSALATWRNFQLNDSLLVLDQIIERDRPLVVFAKQFELSNEENVTPAELAQFKARILPELAAFAAGTPSREEYKIALRQKLDSRITFKSLVLASMGPFSWIWIFFGVLTAYKAGHKEETVE